MANSLAALDGVFHALADPTRRAVIERLGSGPASVKELCEPFDMALPSFMKHLAVLEACGLVGSRKVGRVRTCRIRRDRLAGAESWIAAQRAAWEARTDRLTEFVEAQPAQEKST